MSTIDPGLDALPQVAGRMEMTHADFQRACRVQLDQQEDDPMPNKALIYVLYEAVRCSREAVELAESKAKSAGEFRWHPASEPPSSIPDGWEAAVAENNESVTVWCASSIRRQNTWPNYVIAWLPLPPRPAPAPDDGFRKFWEGLPLTSHPDPDFRLINGGAYHVDSIRTGWNAALAAQKGKA